jgi:hypothetical protein
MASDRSPPLLVDPLVSAGGGAVSAGGGVWVDAGSETGVPAEHGTGTISNTRQICAFESSSPPHPARLENTASNTICKVVLARLFKSFIGTLPVFDRRARCFALMIILGNGDAKYLKELG